MTPSTQSVVENHLRAATIGVEAVIRDYTEDSVLITDRETYRGLASIRQFFTDLMGSLPEGFFSRLTMMRQEIVGEVAYIHWNQPPLVAMATDTFVIRNGKILFQTFAAYMPPV